MKRKTKLDQREYSAETKSIVKALHAAPGCEDVYLALWHVPTHNLELMRDMIDAILINRGE